MWVCTVLLLLLLGRVVVLRRLAACVLQLAAVLRMGVLASTVHSSIIIVTVIIFLRGFLSLPDDGCIPYRAITVVVWCRDEGHLGASDLDYATVPQEGLGATLE
jgi:hypothetical protein